MPHQLPRALARMHPGRPGRRAKAAGLAAGALLAGAALLAAPAARAQSAPPIPTVRVHTIGIVAQSPYIVLRDGTNSALINGKSYWSFNDTGMNAANSAGNNFIDNTLSWATSLDATHGITLDRNQVGPNGVPIRFIPFTPGEAQFQYDHDPAHCTTTNCGENLALWGGGIVQDPASGVVIQVFGEEVRGGPVPGFQGVGAGFAAGRVLANGFLQLERPIQNPGHQNPTLMWPHGEQAFADQILIHKGYLYAYGARQNGLALEVVLARVPLGHFTDKSAYTYYAGNGVWSTNVADCATLFDGGSSGSSIFYDAYLRDWVAVYTAPLSDKLYYRVGAAPEGPWSDQTFLVQGQAGVSGSVDYAGKAHPEFSPDGGRTIYVTYVHNLKNSVQQLPLVRVVFTRTAP